MNRSLHIGPHCIGVAGSLQTFLAQTGTAAVKYLNPDKPGLPQLDLTVGRDHLLSEEKDLSDPVARGLDHGRRLEALAKLTGITIWEGLNEPPVSDPSYIEALVLYEKTRTEYLQSAGLKSVVLNLSVGWPEENLGTGEIIWDPFRDLLEWLPEGHFLGVHEYWYPEGPLHEASYLHRAGRILRCPCDVPILITEFGCDIAGGQHDGWRDQGLSVAQYGQQIEDYVGIILPDERILAAFLFTYGITGEWGSFDIEPFWSDFVGVFASVEREHQLDNPIRLLIGDDVVEMGMEEYLRGVVPAEMPAQYWKFPDGHVETTESEALKAQATAARSYAMACKEMNADNRFDVTDDTRYQVYDPSDINHHSDEAVQATRGTHLLRDGEVFLSEYVNRCGRVNCPHCQGKNGHDGKTWNDRMCQYGAQAMAREGDNFRQILKHYFGEVTFSDGGGTVGNKTLWKDPATDAHEVGEDGKVIGSRVDIKMAEDVLGRELTEGEVVYRVVRVAFVNEEQARGDIRILVNVLDRQGNATMAKIIKAWPQQTMPVWDETVYDWARQGHVAEFAQGSGNYDPSKHGPLGPYVIMVEQDREKKPVISDWCVGFGLPGNRHVAYEVTYQECLAHEDDVYGEGSESPDTDTSAESGCNLVVAGIVKLLEALKEWLKPIDAAD